MGERDPRREPTPGDVLRGKYTTKRVEHIAEPWALLMQVGSFGQNALPEHGWRKSWEKVAAYRAWAKTATVLKHGDTNGSALATPTEENPS